MSRLYGDLTGSAKTTATRRGSAASGVSSHVRGWNLGVRVEAFAESEAFDGFRVYVTGGSSPKHADLLLAEVVEGVESFDVHIGERFREHDPKGCGFCESGEAMRHNPEYATT